jgi:hypothetical protein
MATESRGTGVPSRGTPGPAECRQMLARVLASNQLRRSERHRAFLSYVCNLALTEPEREIRESEIGCKVFGRPAEYDTGRDNIVRVNASELRHRLNEYFQAEGAGESVIVDIPRGTYRPVFAQRPVAPGPPEPMALPIAPTMAPAADRRPAVRWLIPLAWFLLGGSVSWILAHRVTAPPVESSRLVARFWSRLIQPGRITDVVMADSCLSLYQDLTKESISLNQYLNREYLSRIPAKSNLNQAEVAALMSRRYSSMADFQLVRRLMMMMPTLADQRKLAVYFARDYPAANLLQSNVILIGSKRSDPWAEPFDRLMNFRFVFFEDSNITSIQNEKPLPGEQPKYDQPRLKPNETESYAVVAFLPNLRGTGSALLLAGSNMDGTEAAGEFVTSERLLSELLKRLGGRPKDALPYFEALLHTRRLGAGVSENIEILAVRQH